MPQGIGRFSQLKGLHLANNNLQGSVHESLQHVSDTLISLDLSNNSIAGMLPASILTPSSSLEVIHLDDNRMHGDVPLAALVSMPQRLVFTAARNYLSGSLVMPELARLNGTTYEHHESLLQVLDLSGNRITGTLPPSLMMVNLAILGLSHNSLTGTIPNIRCQVLSLRLNGNQLHGSLPEAMATWSSLDLDFSFNRLTGQLPGSMQYMKSLGALRIRGNSDMTGTIPEGLIRLQTLMLLDIRTTNLQEPAPVSGDLTESTVPPWLQLATVIRTADSSFFHEDDGLPHNETIVCPAAQVRTTSNDTMLHLLLDPLYYHFEGCLCSVRHQAVLNYSHGAVIAMKCIGSPVPKDPLATIIAAVVGPLGALGACLLLVSTYVWVRYGGQSALTLLRAHIKRQKPPQAGHQLVLVLTDIAGSTELWEWDSHIAAVAVEQHDHLLRQYLADFCGYEVTTEGDAFLVAFHDPTDAVCYCLAVQVALQSVEWSEELLQWCQAHVPGSVKEAAAAPFTSLSSSSFPGTLTAVEAAIAAAALLPSSLGGMADTAAGGGHSSHQAAHHAELLSSLPSATQLFRGLRVRMSVATGIAEKITLHKVTSRVEYPGSVTRRVQAMADAPEGGQVLIDGETVKGLGTTLGTLGKRVTKALKKHEHYPVNPWELPAGRSWSGRMIHSFSLKIDNLFNIDGKWTQQHAGSPGSCRSQPSRRWRLQRQHSLDSTGFGHSYRRGKAAVAVVDMGIHKLAGVTEPVHLLTILPPGLEARAHFCPPINSLQQYTPGYFNAPGTAAAPLQVPKTIVGRLTSTCGMPGPTSMCPLPPVVMVFCAIDQYQDMLSANREAAEEMLQQYSDVVRWTLLISGGYECQEQEGSYMIVFASAAAALEWSLLVQEALMEVNWSDRVLSLPGASEVLSAASGDDVPTLHFRGPRVRIGLYKGVPARITPHSSTGRADYFGQLVNRAARYCHTAAHGGQVVASRELIDELVSELSGVDAAQLSQAEGPPWALHADVALAQADHDAAQLNWGRPRMAGRTASFASSMAGRGSDNGGLPAAAATAFSPCYGGRRGTAETITAASDGAAASSDSHRKPSNGSAVLALQQTSLLRVSSQKESRAAGHGPLGRFGSSISTSTAPSTKPKAPLSGRQSAVMGMGISGMQLMPDVSALLIMRKAAADTSISSGKADDGKKGSPAVQLAHGMKQLYAAALDIDYGLASGLYARLLLHKWKWAELLLVHDLGQFTFKGISGSHSLVAISTKALGGRQFPHNLRKAKGERLVKGKGLLYKAANNEHMCFNVRRCLAAGYNVTAANR
eukprot:gene12686-12816_t